MTVDEERAPGRAGTAHGDPAGDTGHDGASGSRMTDGAGVVASASGAEPPRDGDATPIGAAGEHRPTDEVPDRAWNRTAALRSAGYVVAAFAAVGVGYGLAANFTIGFFIEAFVEPGANPLDNTLVGIVLIVSVLNTLVLGPVMAGVSGLAIGRSYPDRRVFAAAFNALAATVGFYLMAGLALFLAFGVLSQYAPPEAASGGGGPFSPADLLPTIVEIGIPTAIVGAVAGYVGSRFAE